VSVVAARSRARRGALDLRSERAGYALLALIVAVAAAVYTHYALRLANFQADEGLYMSEARYLVNHFPGALFDGAVFIRGLQRIDPLLLATPFAFMRGPGAFEFDRVVQCLLFASTAIPVFIVARGTGLPRGSQLLAAALAVAIPWAVVSGSFLSESAAYPAYAWALCAVWYACVRGSFVSDLLAVLALALAALSRTALLALAPLLPLAVVWHELAFGLRGAGALERLRRLPGALWHRHRLVTVLVLAVAAIYVLDAAGVLPGTSKSLTGRYGVPVLEPFNQLLDRYRYYLSRLAVGTGFLALAVGLPWTLRTLARPRDGARNALAVVCLLGIVCVLASLLNAGPDERYVMYAAVPVALMFAAALSERLGWGVLLATIAVAALIDSATWPEAINPYDFFTYPAAIFYRRALVAHLASAHGARTVERVVVVGLVLLALIVCLLVARRPRWRPGLAVVLGVGVLGMCVLQTGYDLRKFIGGAGGGADAAARSFVDDHVPSGARVGALAVSLGESSLYLPIWEATEFWNTSVEEDVYFESPGYLPMPLGSEAMRLTIQPDSGLIGAYAGPGAAVPSVLPRYVLVPLQGTNRIVLAGSVVAQSSWVPLELVKVSRPARALWSIANTSFEGFLTSGVPADATIYSGALSGAGRLCASFSLIAPLGFKGRWPYVARSGAATRRGWLTTPEQPVKVELPLEPSPSPHGRSATVTAEVHGQASFPGAVLSAKLAFFDVARCQNPAG